MYVDRLTYGQKHVNQLIEKIIENHNKKMKSQNTISFDNKRKTNVPKRTTTRPKVVLFEPVQKKSNTMSKKSGYDPAKVRSERKKKGLSVTFRDGSSTLVKQPNREPYNPAKVRELREQRKEVKTTVKVQNVIKKPVFSPKTSKMSSGYNPAKVRAIREQRDNERAKGLVGDFDKYMVK